MLDTPNDPYLALTGQAAPCLEMMFTRLHGGAIYPTVAQAQAAYNAVIATGVSPSTIGLIALSELVFQQLLAMGTQHPAN
jgi:hypothetical protein